MFPTRERLREIKAYAKLDHPNIVPIYEAGEHEGRPYITVKLMKGGSLAEEENLMRYLKDPEAAARLVEKIARAVHHLHQRGIVHRDLKAANILLDEAGEPYVVDFGVAKHLDESEHGTAAGTLPYMAPEQVDYGNEPGDPRSPERGSAQQRMPVE